MALDLQTNPVNDILYVSFNQDFTCFVCGTETGFRVYSTDPFRLTWSRDFEPDGGLGVVAMLFRTNILAFVGGGRRPKLQPHKVVLWDDRQANAIAELRFRSPVRAIRLRRELVVVVLISKVYVYWLKSLTLLDSIETCNNPKGMCCLSTENDCAVLVVPDIQQGRATAITYNLTAVSDQEPKAASCRERTVTVPAHDSSIAAMASDLGGTILATASDKGTIVRVYDTTTGERLQELRRGADRAEIHSLVFSPSGEFLAVSSDKGTIHLFATGRSAGRDRARDSGPLGGGAAGSNNAKSSFLRISKVLPSYFSSEWSLAQFRVPDYRCIAAFGSDPHTIIALCANGSYYKARFDPVRGGEMVREDYQQFDAASVEDANARAVFTDGTGTLQVPASPAPASSSQPPSLPHEVGQDLASGAASDVKERLPQEAGDGSTGGTPVHHRQASCGSGGLEAEFSEEAAEEDDEDAQARRCAEAVAAAAQVELY